MTSQLSLRPLLLAGLIALGGGLCPLPAASAGDALEAGRAKADIWWWAIRDVDAARNVGTHLAVALHPDTGEPYMSYYDSAGGDLWFARHVAFGGNCGTENRWSCQVVDSGGDVGQYSSIAVFTDAAGLNVAISYHDATTGSLKVATGLCTETCVFATWLIDGGYPPGGSYAGRYSSVVHSDWGGNVLVAYQEAHDDGGEAVRLAQTVSSGGNCGAGGAAGRWQCDTIYGDNDVGYFNWLTLDSLHIPHISYYLKRSDSHGPYHLWYDPSVPQWRLDSSWVWGHFSGASVSHIVEASGLVHQAFLDETTEELVYATYVGTGGNCGYDGSNNAYWCDVIDGVGVVDLSNRTAAMAADPAGYPIIAYRYAYDGFGSELRLAQPLAAAPPGWSPNCGPSNTWVCSTVDVGVSVENADAVSIASNAHGTAIAYLEDNDYDGDLKVALRFVPLFADDFESGDTSAWSAVVP